MEYQEIILGKDKKLKNYALKKGIKSQYGRKRKGIGRILILTKLLKTKKTRAEYAVKTIVEIHMKDSSSKELGP